MPPPPDPERQSVRPWAGRDKPGFSTHFLDAVLSPFNMWAPLRDYDLEQRLSDHPDERVHDGLYKFLIDAENLRTEQWRIAYWVVAVSASHLQFCKMRSWLIAFERSPSFVP